MPNTHVILENIWSFLTILDPLYHKINLKSFIMYKKTFSKIEVIFLINVITSDVLKSMWTWLNYF